MERECELSSRSTIRAVRAYGYVIFLVRGELPSPGYTVDVDVDLIDIFPPQFRLLRCPTSEVSATVITPFAHAEALAYPSDVAEATVRHEAGADRVTISDVATSGTHEASADISVGVGPGLDPGTAFAAAVANFPPPPPVFPEPVTSLPVVDGGAFTGGGFNHVWVALRRTATVPEDVGVLAAPAREGDAMGAPRRLADLFQLTRVVDDGKPDSVASRESVVFQLDDTGARHRARYRLEYLRVPPDVRLAPPPDLIAPAQSVRTSAGALTTIAVPTFGGEDQAVSALLPRVEFPEVGAGGVPSQVTFDTHLVYSELDPHLVATGVAHHAEPHGFGPARCTAGRTEWSRGPDGSYPAELPHGMFRKWSDTHQDQDGQRVFHPAEEVTAPARFRESFELRPDGVFVDFVLAPNDAVIPVSGRWRTTGPFKLEVGDFADTAATPRTVELSYYESDVLKIRSA